MKKQRLLAAVTRIVLMFALVGCAQAGPSATPHANSAQTFSGPGTTGLQQPTFAVTTGVPTAAALVIGSSTAGIPANATAPETITGAPIPPTGGQVQPQYSYPLSGAQFVSKSTAIAVRYGPNLDAASTAGLSFAVTGAQSGVHTGQVTLADDHQTVLFKPTQPFTPGETVTVTLPGLHLNAQTDFASLHYTFTVATHQQPGGVGVSSSQGDQAPRPAFPNALTIPQDIPKFTVSKASPDDSAGYIFVSTNYWTRAITGAYLLILDGRGNLVYYKSMAGDLNGYDFKEQPNGTLSYFSQKDNTFYVMDQHYQIVASYQAGNGYTTDLHDLQLLPNSDALLMAYDQETIDMSQIVKNGKPDAAVTGLIVQELDPSRNVIFEWRSWDHVGFIDSTADLTEDTIDLVHGNALELANDGNILLSSRNLSEVTKIDRKTGAVLWRMGGKANMFTFQNLSRPFAYQHDIRQLPNGNLTLFDNQGTQQTPSSSRGIEFALDEANLTAKVVWEFTRTPPVFATFMGDTQRLPDGSTFLGWGAALVAPDYQFVSVTEVDTKNQIVFELSFDPPYVSYRAFRQPWQGAPSDLPALAFKREPNGLTLGYSWNGATEVAAWRILGGTSPDRLTQVDQKAKMGFETQSQLTGLLQNECYFQVAPLDANGKEMARSAVISTDAAACPLK
jgi:hypothetical protein